MNEHIKDYFYFSRGEKNGLIVLLGILIILIAIPFIVNIFPDKKTPINDNFSSEIDAFTQSIATEETHDYQNRLDQYIIERYDSLKLFHFNPNSTSNENYKKLGLTDKQISTINNYIEKGGKFYIKDDFRKIYGIRQPQYQILKPFILLPDKKQYLNDEKNQFSSDKIDKYGVDSIFVFDPNKSTDKEFSLLGLTEKQIATIRNYQSKGGKFSTKEDLKKIYGIQNEQYNKLEPYILIQNEKVKQIVSPEQTVELNASTLEQLVEIKGIGKYTATEIIKYRQKLGGYVNISQLLEIKSIKPETLETYQGKLSINPNKIKKLSLNFSEVEDFASHPYLNYYQAKEIVKYRSTHGPFIDKKELVNEKILLEGIYKKIEPYITIN